MKFIFGILTVLLAVSCASNSKDELTPEQKKAEIYYNYGTNALTYQRYTESLKYLLNAYKLRPDDSRICNNLGMAYYFKGQTPLAIQSIKRSIELDPKNSDALNNLASIYYGEKKYDEALALYQRVASDLIYPHQYRTYGNMGLIYEAKGMNLAAIEHFKLSIKENPNFCPSYYNLGNISMKRSDYATAIKAFSEGIKGQCVDQGATHLALANAYIKNHQVNKAADVYRQYIELFPNSEYTTIAKEKLAALTPSLKQQKNDNDIEQAMLMYEQLKNKKSEVKSPAF